MKLLAIETSCDDTGIAILNDLSVVSQTKYSQGDFHKKYGGVIPEYASRLHSEHIFSLIKDALKNAKMKISEINAIAVTVGPGMVTSLQVGITVATTLSDLLGIPLYEINHLDAHAFSPFIGKPLNQIPHTALVLIVSGGHTLLAKKTGFDIKILGQTRDDSIGEVYDKVALKLKINYPGGPIIDSLFNEKTLNEKIDAPIINLPRYDFSYSGLKSHINRTNENDIEKIVNGFQYAAIWQLMLKLEKATAKLSIKKVIVAGGVSANSYLRKLLDAEKFTSYYPKMIYTTDNAAMVGYLAMLKINNKSIKPSKRKTDAKPQLKIGKI